MPTSKWMLERSRGAVALLAAVVLVGVAPTAAGAAAAPSSTSPSSATTSSTTTTTVPLVIPPPPEPFGLPLDIGLKLIEQKEQANKDLSRFGGALPRDRAALVLVQKHWDALQAQFVRLVKRIRTTQHD